MSSDVKAGLSPVKQALIEIRRLKEELERERQRSSEPVAIIGAGLRFPGGVDTLDRFWTLLRNGTNAVGPVPPGRWDHERWFDPTRERPNTYYIEHGGFIDDVDGFDPEFFGIAPLEAETMDPQQRLLLETSWEALEDAGIAADRLKGSSTGVFVGIGTTDYNRLVMQHGERIDAYASSGTALSVAAGRISYLLGLHGPAISIDTACSSSLVAIHLACRSLRQGESSIALAGGVNVMLSPELTVDFCSAGMLSPDGRCRTFDAGANGYVRSEGCGVVVLKRLRDAERDGDRILAVIRGSAINQDGRSSGLTAPNGPAQEAVLRAALGDAGVEPADITYVEAHGTGTSLGDPIEVQALGTVFGSAARQQPLQIGSVKTNLGHLEAAAGMAGLLKAVEIVRRGEIVPSLHFTKPNPHIDWARYPLAVPTESIRLDGAPIRAGVSSFGFSGTNAHVVIESPPDGRVRGASRGLDILTLSAPQEPALRALVERVVTHLRDTTDDLSDVCATLNAGRATFSHRIALVAGSIGDARARLEAWLGNITTDRIRYGVAKPVGGIALILGDPMPASAEDIERIAEWPAAMDALRECGALDGDGHIRNVDDAAFRHATVALLRSWGIAPVATLGTGRGRVPATDRGPESQAATRETITAARDAGAEWFICIGTCDIAKNALPAGHRIDIAHVRDALDALARLHTAGFTPDWRAAAAGHRRVSLPTYPFQRRPFWFTERDAITANRVDPWRAAVTAAAERAELAPVDVRISDYAAAWESLGELAEVTGHNTLVSLGAFADSAPRTADEIIAAAGIGSLYRQIVARWLDAMVRRNALVRDEQHYAATRTLEAIDTTSIWSRVRERLATDPYLLRYLEHTVPLVPDVLAGRVSALETLFPDGSFDLAADLYEKSSVLRYVNGIAAKALQSYAGTRPVRVLEVGAGTGGTTSSLLPALAQDAEYVYTDVSDIFLDFGRSKFAHVPFVRTALFDIEKDARSQGLELHSFDVIVGSNSVHAARDLRSALGNIRSLLKPGGLLLLVESTGHHAWHDVSTGLIEGWQHFTDELRADTPLLPPATWSAVLADAGFADVAAFPGPDGVAAVLKQHVILAHADSRDVAATAAATPRVDKTVTMPTEVGEQRVEPVAAVTSNGDSEFRVRLLTAVGPEREDVATAAVRECVMEVLRSDPGRPPSRDARLMDLGLDSLMAVRLRNLLQKRLVLPTRLPATLAFDYPTIRQIAGVVTAAALGSDDTARRNATPVGVGVADVDPFASREAELAAMSDAEVEALLEGLDTDS